jgi:hypothetical protein
MSTPDVDGAGNVAGLGSFRFLPNRRVGWKPLRGTQIAQSVVGVRDGGSVDQRNAFGAFEFGFTHNT